MTLRHFDRVSTRIVLLQDVELVQYIELLPDIDHLKVLAFLNACSSRFKVGLKDLSLVLQCGYLNTFKSFKHLLWHTNSQVKKSYFYNVYQGLDT